MDECRLKRLAAVMISLVMIISLCGACKTIDTSEQTSGSTEQMATETEPDEESMPEQQTTEVQEESEQSTPESTAEAVLAGMTLEEKLGQMMLVNFRSWKTVDMEEADDLIYMNDEIQKIIGDYHIGNVILFGENTKTTEQTAKLTAAMQKAAADTGNLPLIIGIDQEGGIITRLGQGTCMPGNMAIGATGHKEYAYDNGLVIGEELAALGIQADFAPDADVNDNPQNPIINLRSFGDHPEQVAEYVTKMQEGLNAAGVLACAKHFPGHGNTATDTHTGLAIVEKSEEEWEQCEKLPFQAAAENQMDIIMTAHIQYPGLDDTKTVSKADGSEIYLPATLSKKIVTGLLKEEMGFAGVVSTDAMDMQAITTHFGETEAIIMAIEAGVDMLCNPTSLKCSDDAAKLQTIYEAVGEAVRAGRLSEARIDDAVLRILKLKERYGLLEQQNTRLTTDNEEQAVEVVGSKAHREKEREIAEAAVTLYNGENRKPFLPKEGMHVLFLLPDEGTCSSVSFAVNRLLQEKKIPNITTECYVYEEMTEPNQSCIKKIEEADYILVASKLTAAVMEQPEHWQVMFPQKACEWIQSVGAADRTAIISTALPYDAVSFPDEPVYITYGYKTMSQEDAKSGIITGKYGPNIPAAVGAALGVYQPEGKLPVKID